MSVDWEIGEACRDFRHRYGDEGALERIREFWTNMWAASREPYLYTGAWRGIPSRS